MKNWHWHDPPILFPLFLILFAAGTAARGTPPRLPRLS